MLKACDETRRSIDIIGAQLPSQMGMTTRSALLLHESCKV